MSAFGILVGGPSHREIDIFPVEETLVRISFGGPSKNILTINVVS